MGKTNKSGLSIGVGTSPQGSITQSDFDNKVNELLKKDNMFKPLIDANVKFNAENVLFVTKDKSGQMIWLETGNDGAGLKHILAKMPMTFAINTMFLERILLPILIILSVMEI